MDFQVLYTKPSLADLEEIVAYSWATFPATSERFTASLLNHVDLLKSFPYIGSPVVARPDIRQLIHTPISIYYRVNAERKRVEILHLWHGARADVSF